MAIALQNHNNKDATHKDRFFSEVPLFIVLVMLVALFGYSYFKLGSPRKIINMLANSPKITYEE